MSFYHKSSLLFVLIIVTFGACKPPETPITSDLTLRGETMGTTYMVKYHDPQKRTFKPQIDSLLRAVNQDLSTYIPTSHISVFNRPETLEQAGTPHFNTVFAKANEIYTQTDGAFDPTVMPLVNYWGFGYTPKKAVTKIDSVKINDLMQGVGFEKIQLDEAGTYQKVQPSVQLDFSAIAKGYGVDVIADFLTEKNIDNYLVEIGGELRAKGKNPRKNWWLTGINTPKIEARLGDFQARVMLPNRALATSGNYRNFYEVNEKKYAHTINPKTGYPEANTLLSASIFAPDCMTADAYATACMVLGTTKAQQLVNRLPELEAYLIYSDAEGEMQVYFTEGLEAFLR